MSMPHTRNEQADALLDKEFQVLDHGFVRLVDYMGGDGAIVQAGFFALKPGHQDAPFSLWPGANLIASGKKGQT